jgi:hypothetical protein
VTRYLSAGVSIVADLVMIPLRRLACAVLGHQVFVLREVSGTFVWCKRCGEDL